MKRWIYVFPLVAATTVLVGQEPCRSGLQPGVRPGPYSSVVVTGPNRGTSHCFICETADKPAIIVFARTLNDSLGKLAHGLDRAVVEHKDADLRAWITFLHEDQAGIDAKLVKWAQKHAVSSVPLAVFEELGGPPSYKLARDADVTVLLSVKQKVVANFAFREGELTDARIDEVLKAVPQLVKK
jgi:hypothetical protein